MSHSLCFLSFPLFSVSPLRAAPHPCPPSPTPTLTRWVIMCSCFLLLLSDRSTFSLSALSFPSSLTLCPQARHSPTFPSSLAVLCLSLRHVHPCPLLPPPPPPFLPSITCVHAVRGGVLIPRLADRHSNGRLGLCDSVCVLIRVCTCLCVCACLIVCWSAV